ncbi:MAG: hypothetical protein P0119_06850 [Nitrospira sp.]|nr:hypothetical protein [Nitrospira sp.]
MTQPVDPLSILGIPLKAEVDIGHLLTGLTLVAGFAWWVYTTLRATRRTRLREAEDGALRLLRLLLRERRGEPISLEELQKEYNLPEQRDRRRAYCKRDYRFKTSEKFEAAIYALDWEGKVDFGR